VQKIIAMVRSKTKAKVLVDAAQAMTMLPVEVQKMDCDFLVFSGHKTFGPFGIGVLFGKEDVLNSMPPFLGGGSMIAQVSFEETTFLQAPQRFEAGTPNVTGAVGLAESLDFIETLGIGKSFEHEKQLLKLATDEAKKIEGFRVFGETTEKVNILSFTLDGAHHSDVGNILDQQGVAIRAGHHCNQPLMKKFGIQGTARASFSVYNNESDVEKFIAGLTKAKEMLT
jgi:cysteine desulfurase/selenocysteine lyase